MKKILTLIVATALALTMCVSLAACNDAKVAEGYSYVSLKINPEIEFVVDGDGNVESVIAANEDAEVLLSDVDLEGKTIEEAVQEVVDMAAETGYLDVDTEGDEVEVAAIDEEGNEDAECYAKVEKSINDYFANNGIYGRVSKDTLDLYLADAAELGLPIGKVKILMLACDVTGMTLDELKDKPMGEIRKLINEKKGNKNRYQEKTATKEQKRAQNANKYANHKAEVEADGEQMTQRVRDYQQD